MSYEHTITKMDIATAGREIMHFVCSAQPAMEIMTFEEPRVCPVCRMNKPIKMGEIQGVENF